MKTLKLGLKIIFVMSLFYFLAQRGFISAEATKEAIKEGHWIIPAWIAMFGTTLLGAIRWKWLLKVQRISIDWSTAIRLTLIGNFFNIALPGAVSGDFVKAYYIGRIAPGQKSQALGSIVFDRLAGLSALVLVSAGAFILSFQGDTEVALYKGIRAVMGGGAACVLLFYTYLFLVKEERDPVLKILKAVTQSFPKGKSLISLYQSIRHYSQSRIILIQSLILSIVIHLIVGACCLAFCYSFHQEVSWLGLYLVVPLGLLITAIPIAPAGLGTGNVAFFYFFQLIGSNRGADVYSLFALGNLIIGGLGGLLYLTSKSDPKLQFSKEISP